MQECYSQKNVSLSVKARSLEAFVGHTAQSDTMESGESMQQHVHY